MTLQIVVEVAGTVCDVDCSIFSQTVDRQPPPTADRSLACQVGRSIDVKNVQIEIKKREKT